MRVAAEATTEYAAGLLGIDRSKISNIEAGIRGITPERIRTLACNYACHDTKYIEALIEIATDRVQGWWESLRGQLPAGLLDIAELEWHGRSVRNGIALHLPGLLQTVGYARALFKSDLPPLSRGEIELRVTHRMQRQIVLHRDDPISYVGYVHEAALRVEFGGAKVMRDQLDHLCEVSEQDNIRVQVIPFKAGAFPGAGQTVMYVEGPVPQLDTVQLDSSHGALFAHGEAQLDKYRSHLDWMDEVSLTPTESRDFIQAIARENF